VQSIDFRRVSELAQHWLSNCIHEHPCGGVNEVQLPSRVINVTRPDSNQLRLHILGESTFHRGRYVALYYCWGTSPAFTTTAATLTARMKGFSLSSLPLTLRDAVLVTRKLSCIYLWVDALCILRGSDEKEQKDWEREFALMDTVYSNALVIITAAASSDCDGGLFHPRHCYLPSR
jgi:hypothetical protein